jgi:YD repeat-containing protein
MKITKYYHKNSEVVAFSRFENENGFVEEETYDERGNILTHKESSGDWWYESTYDEQGNELTYKSSNGYFEIKGKEVTEEEFNNFLKYKQ